MATTSGPGYSSGSRVVTKRATDEGGRTRREIELLRLVRHPGVVELVEVDEALPAMATSYVGPDLSHAPALALEEAAGLAAAVATTVADLHEAAVVHGAIAPEHVLLAPDGRPVLCGFAFGGRVDQLPVALPEVPEEFADPARRPTDRLQPSLDVYGLGALTRFLVARVSSPGIGPAGGHRRSAGVDGLARLAAAATGAEPGRRPTAREIAAKAIEAVPGARLPRPRHDSAAAADGGDVAVVAPPGATSPTDDTSRLQACRRRLVAPGRPPSDTAGRQRPRRQALVAAVVSAGLLGAVTVALVGSPAPSRPPASSPALGAVAGETTLPAPTSTGVPAPAPDARSHSCPVVRAVLAADVDDDGCTEALRFHQGVMSAGELRWQLGHAGDLVAVGDWACRGTRTVALLRPSTGRVYRFDGWADAGEELGAVAAGRVDGGVAVRAADVDGDGCHELVVDRDDQQPVLLALRG